MPKQKHTGWMWHIEVAQTSKNHLRIRTKATTARTAVTQAIKALYRDEAFREAGFGNYAEHWRAIFNEALRGTRTPDFRGRYVARGPGVVGGKFRVTINRYGHNPD